MKNSNYNIQNIGWRLLLIFSNGFFFYSFSFLEFHPFNGIKLILEEVYPSAVMFWEMFKYVTSIFDLICTNVLLTNGVWINFMPSSTHYLICTISYVIVLGFWNMFFFLKLTLRNQYQLCTKSGNDRSHPVECMHNYFDPRLTLSVILTDYQEVSCWGYRRSFYGI